MRTDPLSIWTPTVSSDPNLAVAQAVKCLRSGQFLRMDTRVIQAGDIPDNATASLSALLPGSLLFPVPRVGHPEREALPLVPETQDPAYGTRLAVANIGIALGPRSNGLSVMHFLDRYGFIDFLERNPTCAQSLITAHADGLRLWSFARVPFRHNVRTSDFAVQMTGAVLLYDRFDLGRPDCFVTMMPPRSMDLTTIDWPDAQGEIDVWLTTISHGPLFTTGRRGKTVPSRDGWLDYLTRHLRRAGNLRCDAADRRFYRLEQHSNAWTACSEIEVLERLCGLVREAPVDSAFKLGGADAFLPRMIPKLKVALRADLGVVDGMLRGFLENVLIKKSRSHASKPELFAAFEHYRQAGNIPPIPRKVFARLVRGILAQDPWGLADAGSIPSAAGDQNGYWGVALRDRQEEKAD